MTIGAMIFLLCLIALPVSLALFPRQLRPVFGGDVNHLWTRDSTGWHPIELPGIPYEIQASSNGDVWVATNSPSGLSSWSSGHWTHHGKPHYPYNGYTVSGDQAWVAGEKGIERFDGQAWQKLSATIRDPMAMTSEGNEAWFVNGQGVLAHCIANDCQTHSIKDQLPNHVWGGLLGRFPSGRGASKVRRFGYGSLIRAFGYLWFIRDGIWYSSDGARWIEWRSMNDGRAWPLRFSGDRVWVKTWQSLLAIGPDLNATPFPLAPAGVPSAYEVNAESGRVMMASGALGLFERSSGAWSPALPESLRQYNVWNVAQTRDGTLWMTASHAPKFSRVYIFGGLLLLALIIWNGAAIKPRESQA